MLLFDLVVRGRVEVPGLVLSPVRVGAGTEEGGGCVSGVRNSPSAQAGWALGTLDEREALLILGEGKDKPQPYPGDNGLLSFSLSPSSFFEVMCPVHIMSSSPQGSGEVGAAVPAGWRRPEQGKLLEGAWQGAPRGSLT